MAFYQFKRQQLVYGSMDEVWAFVSSPVNLKRITPPSMGFDIVGEVPSRMYPGMIIQYDVKPLAGIKTRWVTEITHVREGRYFVDEQRVGPYSIWHHQHILEPHDDGVFMTDIVSYKPPFGFLGRIANSLIIRNKLEEIFDFRTKALNGIFPEKQRLNGIQVPQITS